MEIYDEKEQYRGGGNMDEVWIGLDDRGEEPCATVLAPQSGGREGMAVLLEDAKDFYSKDWNLDPDLATTKS